MHHRRLLRAFSLIEITVVVAIIGIMSGLAVVTLRDVVLSGRESGGAQAIANALRRGRAVAVNTHSRVRVASTTNGIALSSCASKFGAVGCIGSTSFVALGQGATDLAAVGELTGVQVTGPVTASGTTGLVFAPSGFPETAESFTWTVDHPERPGTIRVVVTAGGEIRVE